MSDEEVPQQPRAHARIVYHGPVAPHWEVYGDWGDRQVLDEFRARVLARLVLLPRDDPQFRRNRERIVRDAEREGRKIMTGPWTQEKIVPVVERLDALSPYYFDGGS